MFWKDIVTNMMRTRVGGVFPRRMLKQGGVLGAGEAASVTHWVIKREANANQERGADVSRKRKLRRMRQRWEGWPKTGRRRGRRKRRSGWWAGAGQ